MSSITRKGDAPIEQNYKKREPPPLADKSYDRHIADSGKQLKWMREAGMLDDGPASHTKGPMQVLARAAVPDIAEGEPVSAVRLRMGRRPTARDIAHLYVTESNRPAVTGVQKGPGGVYYTASAGGAATEEASTEPDTSPVVAEGGQGRNALGQFTTEVEDTPLERVKRQRFGSVVGMQEMLKRKVGR
jgi:hypothetical protein